MTTEKHKHNFVIEDSGWGNYTKLPKILVMLFCKPDFKYIDLICIECGVKKRKVFSLPK